MVGLVLCGAVGVSWGACAAAPAESQEELAAEMAGLLEGMESAQREAAKRRRLEFVPLMSLERMFPDERQRALARAAGRGRVRTVDRLVAEGADVNARGRGDGTALYWAFRKRSLKGFRRLLEHGADPNVVHNDGVFSVMHAAAERRNIAWLEAALRHGGDPNVTALRSGHETPLVEAVSARRREAVGLLVAAGADLEATDSFFGTTAAQRAAAWDRGMLYQLLLLGADYRRPHPKRGHTIADTVHDYCSRVAPKTRYERECRQVIDWLAERGAVPGTVPAER